MNDRTFKKINIKDITSVTQLEKLNISFEDAYSYLEKIVSLQEQGEISLEDSITYYKVGKILSSYASSVLEKAKLDLEKIN